MSYPTDIVMDMARTLGRAAANIDLALAYLNSGLKESAVETLAEAKEEIDTMIDSYRKPEPPPPMEKL